MEKTLFILTILFAFGCAPSPVSPSLTENKAATDRSAVVDFQIQNVAFQPGQTVEAKYSVTGFTDLTAFQYAMQYDTAVLTYSHATFTGAIPDFNLDCCFGMEWMGYFLEPGEVRTAWVKYSPGGLTLPAGTVCYSLFFTAKHAGNLASAFPAWLNNPILPAEASDSQFNILPLTITYLPIPPTPPTGGGNAGNASTTKKKKKRG